MAADVNIDVEITLIPGKKRPLYGVYYATNSLLPDEECFVVGCFCEGESLGRFRKGAWWPDRADQPEKEKPWAWRLATPADMADYDLRGFVQGHAS